MGAYGRGMALLSVLVPGRCAGCERVGAPLCARCDAALLRLREPGCARCGAPGPWPVLRCVECAGRRLAFRRAQGAVAYAGVARTIVSRWKESGRRDLAGPLAHVVADVLARPAVDVLTFVPGDRDRGLERGHVPAAGLALALGRVWTIDVVPLLERSGRRERQASLRLEDRRANVRGVFRARGPAPARVCLIDDVYTSGSTASACATQLRRAGARAVDVVCLARAVR